MPVGIIASGKSTWAVDEVKKDPTGTCRINRDAIRNMLSNYHFVDKNEKLVSDLTEAALKAALKRGYNCIMDEQNINPKNWIKVCKIVKEANVDAMVIEKVFYIDLEEAIARDSKREGSARIGETPIRASWKKSGGAGHKHYKPRTEIFKKSSEDEWKPLEQDETLHKCAIFDNDGTISLLNGRDPYNASTADNDLPHPHIIEMMKLYYKTGHKIIFLSGREEKDRAPTERFYKKHFPEVEYQLFMRPTGSFEKDVIVKKRIYEEEIKNKYYVSIWVDDRLQICNWLYQDGFPFVRANDPNATF